MSQDFSGKYAEKKKSPFRKFLPVIGLIVALLAAGGAYIASEPGAELIQQQILKDATIDLPTLQLITGVMVWVIIIAIFSAVFALFQPKSKKEVSEKHLKAEKQQAQADKRRAERRKRAMKQKMKQANKDLSDI